MSSVMPVSFCTRSKVSVWNSSLIFFSPSLLSSKPSMHACWYEITALSHLNIVVANHVGAKLETLHRRLQQILAVFKGHLSAIIVAYVFRCESVTHVERLDHAICGGFHRCNYVSLWVCGIDAFHRTECIVA
ncbi:hypothetical protein CR513_55897, partial [Mucuna pruriens]